MVMLPAFRVAYVLLEGLSGNTPDRRRNGRRTDYAPGGRRSGGGRSLFGWFGDGSGRDPAVGLRGTSSGGAVLVRYVPA